MAKIALGKYFLTLTKDSFTYGLGNMALKVLALITIPIITRLFSPADYGVINLVASVITFLSLLLIFGMDSAVALSFYQYKKEKKLVVSSGFWFLIGWAIVIVALATIFSNQISAFFLKSVLYRNLLLIGYATAILTLLINFAKTILQLEFRAKTFALLSAVNALLVTGAMLLLILVFKLGLAGYFWGTLLGTIIAFGLTIYFIKDKIIFKISWPRLREMMAYGALLVPASLSTYVFDLSDRYFVSHYRSLDELGLYSMAFNITIIISFFAVALGQAWSPFIMNLYFESKAKYKQFLPRAFSYFLILFASIAVIVCIFSHEFLAIFTTVKYFGASRAIPSLAVAAVLSASVQVTALGISISRQTKYIALVTILTAVLNTALNFILIPRYGMVGAGWSTAISYLFLTGLYLRISQNFIPFAIQWSKILRLIVVAAGVIALAPFLWRDSFWLTLLIKGAEVIVYFLLLFLTDVIEGGEINFVRGKLTELRAKNAK